MRFSSAVGFSLVSAVLPLLAVATEHGANHARHHHDLAARHSFSFNATSDVEKRGLPGPFENARFTFYDVGLGACGKVNVPSDFIVALDSALYGNGYPGPYCFMPIVINYGGKTAHATIMDECPGCPYGGLDFSRGLFDFFADESVGVLYGEWYFADGGSGGGDQTTSTKHTTTTHHTTSTPPPPPSTTTHSSTHSTTSTHSTPSTTSHSSSTHSTSHSTSTSSKPTSTTPSTTSTVTSTSSVNLSSGGASGVAQVTGALTPSQAAGDNLYQLNLGIIDLGAFINAARNA